MPYKKIIILICLPNAVISEDSAPLVWWTGLQDNQDEGCVSDQESNH